MIGLVSMGLFGGMLVYVTDEQGVPLLLGRAHPSAYASISLPQLAPADVVHYRRQDLDSYDWQFVKTDRSRQVKIPGANLGLCGG